MAIIDLFRRKKTPPPDISDAAADVSSDDAKTAGALAATPGIRYGVDVSNFMTSASATRVDRPDDAMKMAEYYNCVNKLSNTVATLTRNFYKDKEKLNEMEYDQVHLWRRMMYPGIIPSKMIKAWVSNYLKGGNGYLIVIRNQMTLRPISYMSRKWFQMMPFYTRRGEVWYYDAVTRKVFAYQDILHLADITDDALIGKTKVSHQAETLGRSRAANEFVNKYFTNGLMMSAFVKYPVGSGITEEDIPGLEKQLQKAYGGLEKSGQVGIITEGGDLQQLKTDIPLGDANYIEAENMTKKDIRGMFNIPDEIKDENTVSQFYNDAIMPIVRMIEEEVYSKITSFDDPGIYMKFEIDSILRADVKTKADVLEKYLRNSIYTINEVRAMLDKAPIEGGDKPLVMANNLVPLSELEEFIKSKM